MIVSHRTWRLENCILAGSCPVFMLVFGINAQNSNVAQWKRAGPIIQRSMDRNHFLLEMYIFLQYILLFIYTISQFILKMFLSLLINSDSVSYNLEVGKLHSCRIMSCFYSCIWNQCAEQQGGAVEVCWAHNPEVDGSKPFLAKKLSIFFIIPRGILLR